MKNIILFLLFISFGAAINAKEVTPQMAVSAEQRGDHKKAIKLFSALANKGDSKAMIHLGNKYYNGAGVKQDYKKAMDWWLKAFYEQNGDAPGNIGVLYRDGKGVKQNRKIAYLLFLATHMQGLGSESTQYRVNNLLRREVAELPQAEIQESLCYTWAYVLKYIDARGELKDIPKDSLPSKSQVRIKDNGWWLDSERANLNFECTKPWG